MTGHIRLVRSLTVAVLLVTLPALVACSSSTDYSARFVRYGTTTGGQQIAIITPLAEEAEEQRAYTKIDDLQPGEEVFVRATGKEWDQPADAPAVEIVSRAQRR